MLGELNELDELPSTLPGMERRKKAGSVGACVCHLDSRLVTYLSVI